MTGEKNLDSVQLIMLFLLQKIALRILKMV